jgi:hypothetical protein
MAVKKQILTITVLLVSMGVFSLSTMVRADAYWIYEFSSDDTVYYSDESIDVHAEYDLEYSDQELTYFQVQLFNETSGLVWESDAHEEEGVNPNQVDWHEVIPIEDLALIYEDHECNLTIRLFYFTMRLDSPEMESYFVEEHDIEIKIKERFTFHSLSTDRELYYHDDVLHVTASWYVGYEPTEDIPRVKITVNDSHGHSFLDSYEYEQGTIEREYAIILAEEPLVFEEHKATLNVSFTYSFNDEVDLISSRVVIVLDSLRESGDDGSDGGSSGSSGSESGSGSGSDGDSSSTEESPEPEEDDTNAVLQNSVLLFTVPLIIGSAAFVTYKKKNPSSRSLEEISFKH